MRHLVITGASTGIGRATAVGLAGDFERITLVGRNAARHAAVLDELSGAGVAVTFVECEMTSLGSVSEAARAVSGPVDVVIANAAVAGRRGTTSEGFELHFGVNHLAHHLLVTALADRIRDRVVVVSSHAHYGSPGLDFEAVRRSTSSITGIPEYRDSKLANVLCGRQLAVRHAFPTHVVHPGVVATDIWRRVPWPIRPLVLRRMAPPGVGADTPRWAATADGLVSGGYYSERTLHTPSAAAHDDDAAEELWERSERWVEAHRIRRHR